MPKFVYRESIKCETCPTVVDSESPQWTENNVINFDQVPPGWLYIQVLSTCVTYKYFCPECRKRSLEDIASRLARLDDGVG